MSSKPRPKVGYIYTPPSNSNNYVSDIIEWVGYPQFDFDNVKNSFFKVAYIKEDIIQTSGLETVFRPVYVMNTDELAMSQTGSIVPDGWKKMCMYTDEEFATLPTIQKVVNPQDAMIPLSYSADPGDEDFMSAISSLSEGIWMDNNTTVFEAPPLAHPTSIGFGQLSLAPETLPVSQPPAVAPHIYGGPALLLTTLIPPADFHIGIKYTKEYLEKHFVATWDLVQTLLEYVRLGDKPILQGLMSSSGRRVGYHFEELRSSTGESQTGQQKDLNIFDAIGLVISERCAFVKSLKASSAAYIDRSDRASIRGYNLLSKSSQRIPGYINELTGLTSYRSVATSIDFTRDDIGRLLRPVVNGSNISVLDLFFDDYNEIPEQLLSTVCAMASPTLAIYTPWKCVTRQSTSYICSGWPARAPVRAQ
ncbi:hypothetical protein DFJ58DRAFT_848601 [Suillus subalutaceus]|uniref:uncharacterized protein n=1 Tax=Suillus subalutaceus TaxID=48586 RepID=UPI001B866242|nr:uncharacterized protein DFJ58DRAFT_848601 [Suillus subalutaceus]KAG1829738.1 hypothetical protein DFJ58DRAFT_848601 [Suillus subalutaceus]